MNGIDLDKLKIVQESMLKTIEKHAPEEKAEAFLAEQQEFIDFRTSLMKESDRGSALMAAAFIDDKVKQLIEAYFVDNKKIRERILEGNGALGTFSSKIDLAFLLGLIPKNVLDDLHLLRKIRNDFAHNASAITFESEPLRDRCYSFTTLSKVLLRDHPKAFFLRAMTTILTSINNKKESFERCIIEEDFDSTYTDEILQKMSEYVQKDVLDEELKESI